MIEHEQYDDIEQILSNYRPVGPPAELRDKVLSAAADSLASSGWQIWMPRLELAAAALVGLVLRFGPILCLLAAILAIPTKVSGKVF